MKKKILLKFMRVKWDLETNTVTSRAFITFLKVI